MSREAILRRIRNALGEPPRNPRSRETTPPAPASLMSTGAASVARFIAEAEAKGVTLLTVREPRHIPGAVARYLTGLGGPAPRVRIADLGWPDVPWADAGIEIATGAAAPDDIVGISRGLAGIAETGTVLLVSSPGNPTTLAFLPEVHIVVLEQAAVAGTFEEATAILRATFSPGTLPRSVNLISGASRTGDIGGRIVHGAHGPRRLAVILVENKQGAVEAP